MIDSITVDGVYKRFRLPTIPRHATVKDMVIQSMRFRRKDSSVEALRNVSFSVEAGSMLGVIGRNGSGKTTLMRVLAGILKPDAGSVAIRGTIAPVLALGTGLHPDLSGREGARIELMAMGFTRSEAERHIPAIMNFAEIGEFFDAPVRTYSAGMAMRLAFSVAICVDPDVLLLDEVLAVGDEAFAQKCFDAIHRFRERGKSIVLVTHNAQIVEQWCDLALWLDEGAVAGLGDPRAVVAAYHALTDLAVSAP